MGLSRDIYTFSKVDQRDYFTSCRDTGLYYFTTQTLDIYVHAQLDDSSMIIYRLFHALCALQYMFMSSL